MEDAVTWNNFIKFQLLSYIDAGLYSVARCAVGLVSLCISPALEEAGRDSEMSATGEDSRSVCQNDTSRRQASSGAGWLNAGENAAFVRNSVFSRSLKNTILYTACR